MYACEGKCFPRPAGCSSLKMVDYSVVQLDPVLCTCRYAFILTEDNF